LDLMGAVPMAPLHVSTRVLREGRRLQVVEAEVSAAESGTVAVRARILRIRTEATGISTDTLPTPGPGPQDSAPLEWDRLNEENFATTAMELRFAEGAFQEIGPARCWFRVAIPVVDDETPSPLQLVMAASDFGNGISRVLDFETHLFINPDLT